VGEVQHCRCTRALRLGYQQVRSRELHARRQHRFSEELHDLRALDPTAPATVSAAAAAALATAALNRRSNQSSLNFFDFKK